jgi:hypothetical protein
LCKKSRGIVQWTRVNFTKIRDEIFFQGFPAGFRAQILLACLQLDIFRTPIVIGITENNTTKGELCQVREDKAAVVAETAAAAVLPQ